LRPGVRKVPQSRYPWEARRKATRGVKPRKDIAYLTPPLRQRPFTPFRRGCNPDPSSGTETRRYIDSATTDFCCHRSGNAAIRARRARFALPWRRHPCDTSARPRCLKSTVASPTTLLSSSSGTETRRYKRAASGFHPRRSTPPSPQYEHFSGGGESACFYLVEIDTARYPLSHIVTAIPRDRM
jgi:hypothetical protein